MSVRLLLVALATYAFAADASQVVEQLRAKIEQVRAFTARVAITVDIESFKVPRAEGTLVVRAPDSVRFTSDQLTFVPKGSWQLSPFLLLRRQELLAFDGGMVQVGSQQLRQLRLLPRLDTGELVAASLYVDMRDTTIERADVTTRSSGTLTLDFDYGAYRALHLPDRVRISVTLPPYAVPKVLTGDITPYQTQAQRRRTEPIKGTITITFERYTIERNERRNFIRR